MSDQPADHGIHRECLHETYEEHILLKLVNSTVQDVCLKEAIGYEAIMGIIDRHIQGAVDWNQFAHLGILGLDEISLKGPPNFVALSQDVLTIRQSSWECYQIAKEHGQMFLSAAAEASQTVKAVCSDMYDGFIYAVQEVFGNGSKSLLIAFMWRSCIARAWIRCASKNSSG